MHNVNWDDLRIVLAVADAGSVNAAARRLGVNHATVLRRLANFETAAKVSLFQKSARGYRVDPSAHAVITALRSVERSVEGFDRVVAGQERDLEGIVRITSTDSLCQTILPPIIRDIHARHPGLSVELLATNARLNLSKLDADITIRPARSLPGDLVGDRVATMSFQVYCARGYSKEAPQKDRWLAPGELLGRSPVGVWAQSIPEEQIVARADSFVTLARLAATGLGLTMIPSILGDAAEDLERAPGHPHQQETGLWVASHPDLRRTPRIAACVSAMADALREHANWIAGNPGR